MSTPNWIDRLSQYDFDGAMVALLIDQCSLALEIYFPDLSVIHIMENDLLLAAEALEVLGVKVADPNHCAAALRHYWNVAKMMTGGAGLTVLQQAKP